MDLKGNVCLGYVRRKLSGDLEVKCVAKPFEIHGILQEFEAEKYRCIQTRKQTY